MLSAAKSDCSIYMWNVEFQISHPFSHGNIEEALLNHNYDILQTVTNKCICLKS